MSRKRRISRILRGVAAVALGLAGCKQQTFLDPNDYSQAVTVNLPPHLETNPHQAITPPTVVPLGLKPPGTVNDPERPARPLSLREAIAVALEQGGTGVQSVSQFGVKNEVVATANGASTPDAIRAFALDPASAAASIERALSRFDVRWVTQMNWQKVDQPVAAQFLSFQQQRDAATLSSRFDKPLPTGGLASITYQVDYSKFGTIPANQAASFVNPNYTPRVTFSFQQPLLRQFGVEINQLNDFHPGDGSQTNFNFPVGASPFASNLPGQSSILVTRIRRDQSQVTFESQVNFLLVNIETAYWNLYSSYYNLYAQEEGLRQSYDGYRFTKARVEAGTDPPQNLDQSRAQLELFRSQVYQARNQVLESERQLRGFMGLRSDDGYRLVPTDEPNLAPYIPDFYEAANEAMAYKPELMILRQEVKISQMQLRLTRNLRQPDLRFISSYDVAGLGTRLDGSQNLGADGSTPGNALASFGSNQFNSWNVALRLDVPLGWRDTSAQVRQAQLQLTRNYVQLRDAELKALEFLTQQYRNVAYTHSVIKFLTARREAQQRFLAKFRSRVDIGTFQPQEYLNFTQGQRDLAEAIRQEFAAIAQYNSALAQFEFAKGTILRYNAVHLNEGPLPPGVRTRAADHERERAVALKLRERPGFDTAAASPPHGVGPAVGSPSLPPIVQMPAAPDLGGIPADPKKDPAPLPLPNKNPPPKPVVPDAGSVQPPLTGGVGSPVGVPNTNSFVPQGSLPPQPGDSIFTPTGETLTVPRNPPIKPRGTSVETPIWAPPMGSVPPLPTPSTNSGIPSTLPN
jgi:outer membrane protein TolC